MIHLLKNVMMAGGLPQDAAFGAGAALNVNNSVQIVSTFDDGVGLFNGGSVINNAGAVIQAPTGGGFVLDDQVE